MTGRALAGAGIGVARTPPRDDDQRQRRDQSRQQPAGEQRRDRQPRHTEPIVISTRLGGIVSDIALEVASSEDSSPGCMPRRCISGNRIGATAAMSAAFDPDMPETRYIAPSST